MQEDQKTEVAIQFGELSSKTRFSRFRITLELEMLYELLAARGQLKAQGLAQLALPTQSLTQGISRMISPSQIKLS